MSFKQTTSWEKHPKPKTHDLVLKFRRAFKEVWILFGFIFFGTTLIILAEIFFFKVPLWIGFPFAFMASIALLRILFLSLLGKACCPNCKYPPIQKSGLTFGIALRISRCERCDYPLNLDELEKDLRKNSVI
jgi:hypothetical protein